jgi:hypothetical protein
MPDGVGSSIGPGMLPARHHGRPVSVGPARRIGGSARGAVLDAPVRTVARPFRQGPTSKRGQHESRSGVGDRRSLAGSRQKAAQGRAGADAQGSSLTARSSGPRPARETRTNPARPHRPTHRRAHRPIRHRPRTLTTPDPPPTAPAATGTAPTAHATRLAPPELRASEPAHRRAMNGHDRLGVGCLDARARRSDGVIQPTIGSTRRGSAADNWSHRLGRRCAEPSRRQRHRLRTLARRP